MERFFYQAWKEASLPLPPGAGPTLSRTRPKDPSKGQPLAWAEEQQGSKGNKRKHTSAHYEVCTPLELSSLIRGLCPVTHVSSKIGFRGACKGHSLCSSSLDTLSWQPMPALCQCPDCLKACMHVVAVDPNLTSQQVSKAPQPVPTCPWS